MITLFLLLCLWAVFGAIDTVYYHLYKCRLYEKPDSHREFFTHLTRTVIFFVLVLWVMFVSERARYFLLGLWLLLVFDFINSLADVLLEPHSRQTLGGLSRGEYFIHMLCMFLSGMIVAAAAFYTSQSPALTGPFELRVPHWPLPLILQGVITAALAFSLFIAESAQLYMHRSHK